MKISLRIFSDFYSLNEVKSIFGEPNKGYSKGDVFGKLGKAREKTWWSKSLVSSSPQDFNTTILEAISFLEEKKKSHADVFDLIEVDMFCMLTTENGQGGFELTYPVARALAESKLNVVFDVYAEESSQ